MSSVFQFLGGLSHLCCAGGKQADPGGLLYARIREQEDVAASGRHELCIFSAAGEKDDEEFEEKQVEVSSFDDTLALADQLAMAGIAVTCRSGRHAGAPNQDSFLICRTGGWTILGLADGFGDNGHWVADWVVQYALAHILLDLDRMAKLPTLTLEEMFNAIQRALKLRSAEDSVDIMTSGSTLSLIFVDHGTRAVTSAWVGDSKCVLGESDPTEGGDSSSTASQPGPCFRQGDALGMEDDPRGSMPAWHRHPALERRLGNLAAHTLGGSHIPAVKRIFCGDGDTFVLCCTDAVWEQIDTQEALDAVGRFGRTRAPEAADSLVRLAHRRCLDALGSGSAGEDETYEDMSLAIVWV